MAQGKVLIVGAGPTGLMMALALQRYQVPVRIVDKKEGITKFSKALGMQARTLEVFRDFGLDKKLLSIGHKITQLEFYKGNEQLVQVHFSHLQKTEYPFILGIAQSETERVLLQALQEKGVQVEWGTEVVGLVSHPTYVDVTFSHQQKLSYDSYSWVLGCDGLHSIVRDASHIGFMGLQDENRFALADLQIEGDLPKDRGRAYLGGKNEGLVMIFPFDQHDTRIVLDHCLLPERTTPSLEYLQKEVQTRTKQPFVLKDMTWSSTFHIQYKHAVRFSQGRCFLAGDAAHVHSPIGGQGMNTGLQDAYNLAWKLGLVYHGKANNSLLKTYHEERYKNAKRLLRITHIMTKIGARQTSLFKYLAPHIMKFVFNHQALHDRIVYRMSQLEINYRHMKLCKEYLLCPIFCRNKAFLTAPHAGDRVVNYPATLAATKKKTTLCDLLPGTKFHLVVFLPTQYASKISILEELQDLDINCPQVGKILVVQQEKDIPEQMWSNAILIDDSGKLFAEYGAKSACMYVIRPDQYIGMRSVFLSKKRFKNYLKKWFR